MKLHPKTILRALVRPESILGWLIMLYDIIWKGVKMAGDIEFIITSANSIGNFLATGIGTLVLVAIGFTLIGHALYRTKSHETFTEPSIEEHVQQGKSLVGYNAQENLPETRTLTPINSFHEQFERYESFTVEEAISLLCEQQPMFQYPILDLSTFSSLNPKQSVAKHLIIAEYKAGNISLDHFNNRSYYSDDYSKSRISKYDILQVADKLDDPPEFMLLEDE